MDELYKQLLQLDPHWAYLLLFFSAVVENLFPPIPGDTVTVIGAYLVGVGLLNFWAVYISTTLGSIGGFMGIYGIAYWVEWKVIEKYQPQWLSRTKIDRVENWFRRHGRWVLLLNRFLSGARSVISLVAGLSKLNWIQVFLLALISAVVWNGALIYLGSSVGHNWKEIMNFLAQYNKIVLGSIIIFLLAAAFYKLRKKINWNAWNIFQ